MTSQKLRRVFEALRCGLAKQLEALQRNLAQYPPIDHPMDVSEYEILSSIWAAHTGRLRSRPRGGELEHSIAHGGPSDCLPTPDRLPYYSYLGKHL